MKISLKAKQAILKAQGSTHSGHFTDIDPYTGELYVDHGVHFGRETLARMDSFRDGAIAVTGSHGSQFFIDARTGEPIARTVGDHTVVNRKYR